MSTYNDTPEWLFNLDLELSDNIDSLNQSYADVTFDYADQLVRIDNAHITGIVPKFTLEQATENFRDAAVKFTQNKNNVYKTTILKYEDKIAAHTYNKYGDWLCSLITHKELIDSLIAPLHSNDIVIQTL